MLEFTAHFDGIDSVRHRLPDATSQAEINVAEEVKRTTEAYVPMLPNSGSLRRRTTRINNLIIYPGPYARYLYEGFKMVDKDTGRPAFYIEGVGFRFRNGAKLEKTNKKLVYSRTAPIQAGDHWFEKSKAQNLHRWLETADRAVIHYLRR